MDELQLEACVKTILLPYLENLDTNDLRKIDTNHECFELPEVKAIRKKYPLIESNRWNNFQRLLCGFQDLPVVILQNPSNDHDKCFSEMIQCPTLKWLSETLETGSGLKLEDIIIIDVCSFFSENDLQQLGPQRWDAVEQSYGVTEAILRFLNPSVVISCQCATEGRYPLTWKQAENRVARSLASSENEMKAGKAKTIGLDAGEMWMVYGVHPMRALLSEEGVERSLKRVFEQVYGPCVSWLRERQKQQHIPCVTRVTLRPAQGIAKTETTNDTKAITNATAKKDSGIEQLEDAIGRLTVS